MTRTEDQDELMPSDVEELEELRLYHKDGSLWAVGRRRGAVMEGYWEWFRKDGTKMRSGFFQNGEQCGDWTTYDRSGKIHKVTTIKPKPS